jgi:hypothetical protein
MPTRQSHDRPFAWVVLAFTALAAVFTWPLVAHLHDSIPGDPGDPLLNAWVLGWDADRLRHGLRGLWDAPIFYPYRGTLAFSEHLLGIAAFVAPITWATGNPLIAYNAAFVLSFTLAGAGMFLLARELTGRSDAAWLAGLIFAFSPARLGQIGHLQVLMSGWMPLTLWALHRYLTTPSAVWWLALVAFGLAQSLSNNYFIYFLALPAAVVAAGGLAARGAGPTTAAERRRITRGLAAAGAAVVAALTPIALIYFRVRRQFGFSRTVEDVTNLGADLGAYLHGNEAVHPPLTLWRHLPFVAKPIGPEGELFAGALALGLALAAVVASGRRWPDARAQPVRLYGLIGVFALILSLGAQPTAWGVHLPVGGVYRKLFDWLPGFDGLRVPARFGVVVLLAVAVLGGIGASALLSARRPAVRRILAGAFALIIFLEGYPMRLPLAFLGRGGRVDRGAYDWLRTEMPGPILELPAGEVAPPFQSFGYQYQTLFHHRPIVNGSSGYDSAFHGFIGSAASPLVEPPLFSAGLRTVRAIGVTTIVVHPQAYADPEVAAQTLAALHSDTQVSGSVAFPDIEIFRLRPFEERERPDREMGRDEHALKEIPPTAFVATSSVSADRLPLAFDGNLDTRWLTPGRQEGGEWLELSFSRSYDIARVRFLTSARSVGDYPRQLRILAGEGAGDETGMEALYDGPVVFQLGTGLVRDPTRGPVDVWLRPSRTRRLRLLQTGSTRRWLWAIDELSVWEAVNAAPGRQLASGEPRKTTR